MDDRVSLSYPARAAFHREFEFLLAREQIRLRWRDCGADLLRVTLESRREGMPPDVLGAARRRGGAVLPPLAVFVDPVMEFTRANDWSVVGRALARVAAHEVRHYTAQQTTHAGRGVMRRRFPSRQLKSSDPRPFLP